jgi:hypothetical protein
MIREDGADFKPAGLFVVFNRKFDTVNSTIGRGSV